MVLTILWQVYMFLSAYESIQACQLMEELFGRVKQGFWTITGLNFKWKHEHKQWRRGKQSEENSYSLLSHFWSTSRSLFFACYIPFESLGSQESNASNRVWFGAKMRKIWPSEDNCIKLRDNFARWKARCEFLSPKYGNFAHLKPKYEIGTPTCENWIFWPTLFLLIFLCLNFHFLLVFNQPCNSLARKYPRKGKTTFLYKFSCNHWI